MIMSSPAKINLTLNLLGKLPNKYHELLTIFCLIPDISDRLEFSDSASDAIEIKNGAAPITLSLQDNLIYKMAESIRRKYNVNRNFRCLIDKQIPIGAGLGGGSSNAVATLNGLEKLWGLSIPMSDKEELCARLGSDLNFFLHADERNPVAVGRGRGENIEPQNIDVSWLRFVIIQPKFSLSTRDVFCSVSPSHYKSPDEAHRNVDNILDALKNKDFPKLIANLNNDLTEPACIVEPVLREYIQNIGNCINKQSINTRIMLSGSGSCLFAPFDSDSERDRFVACLKGLGVDFKKIYC